MERMGLTSASLPIPATQKFNSAGLDGHVVDVRQLKEFLGVNYYRPSSGRL